MSNKTSNQRCEHDFFRECPHCKVKQLLEVLQAVQECISHQDFMRVRRLVSGALSGDSSAPETPTEPSAFERLKVAARADHAYAWSLHCNLAVPIMDSGVSHQTANVAAAAIVRHWWDIDVTMFDEWKSFPWSDSVVSEPDEHL